jgi:toxin HigB-1
VKSSENILVAPIPEKIWSGGRSKRLPGEIQERAFLKLRQLHTAEILEDLRIPLSNRLEFSGDLKGLWSMRNNQQWRLVFRWNDGKASDVKITDYH